MKCSCRNRSAEVIARYSHGFHHAPQSAIPSSPRQSRRGGRKEEKERGGEGEEEKGKGKGKWKWKKKRRRSSRGKSTPHFDLLFFCQFHLSTLYVLKALRNVHTHIHNKTRALSPPCWMLVGRLCSQPAYIFLQADASVVVCIKLPQGIVNAAKIVPAKQRTNRATRNARA